MILWGILIIILFICAVCELYSFRTGVPTVSSFPSARKKVIKAVQHILKSYDGVTPTIMDLGAGRGVLTQALGRAYPKAKIIGLEISYFPWLYTVVLQKLMGPNNVEYKREDFWNYNCADIDVIVLYLTENIIERIGDKLWQELRPGAYVIANDTHLRKNWKPIETIETGFLRMKIYIYRK